MRSSFKRRLKLCMMLTLFILIVYLYVWKTMDENGRKLSKINFPENVFDSLQRYDRDTIVQNKSVNNTKSIVNNVYSATHRLTQLTDVFIGVKTTLKNHKTRLKLMLDTWIKTAENQTYIFTDEEDDDLKQNLPAHHVINTNCSKDHYRKSLVCKMGHEFDLYILSELRWFCHVDDDTYLNVKTLVTMLQLYNHMADWYLGKPSLGHPMEILDRSHPGQKFAFWFATGGAGFCVSRSLALKMLPYAGGGRLSRSGEQIRLPDDCTIGYVITSLLGKELTVIKQFHSHLEALWRIGPTNIKDQITLSYLITPERTNIVHVPGFSDDIDPTRVWSIHCFIYPVRKECISKIS